MLPFKIKCPICGKKVMREWPRQRTCLSPQCRQKYGRWSKTDNKRRHRNGTWKREQRIFDEANYQRERKSRPKEIFKIYQRAARKRGLEFRFTFKEFMKWWKTPCFYCGGEIRTIGLDRIDNGKGYVEGNVAPCCKVCNRMKGTMDEKEFLQQCRKIANKK